MKTFARKLGFKNAGEKKFRRLIKAAKQRNLLKVKQAGFIADSMHHPRVVILHKPFNAVKLLNQCLYPSYFVREEVNGYALTTMRTGLQRKLKDGSYSKHEWYRCEDCGKEIIIGEPYASRVDFDKKQLKKCGQIPVFCKCISCFLDYAEEFDLNLG